MAFRFLNFQVYKDAKKLHRNVVHLTKEYPREFYYLKDQLRRCTLSIVLQIAEGSAKRSDKEFNRYIEIGLGSANETAAGLDVSLEEKLITKAQYDELTMLCMEVTNQLGGLSKALLAKK